MKILLVEDHEEIWDFLSRRLRRRGFNVVVAEDGQVAVYKAKSESPDIILLDKNLPVMEGLLAAGEIRADPITAALTAHAMSEDKDKALSAGCTD